MKYSYYDLLTPNGDEIRMNFPLAALKLSKETNAILFKHTRIVDGKIIEKFPTVRDLVSYGKTPLMGLIAGNTRSYNDLEDIIQEIEEKLARIGLRFKDSDFTVGDVRVDSVDFDKETKKVLEKVKYKVKTLDDLSILGARKLSTYFIDYYKRSLIIKDISKKLELYGLRFEGSDYRINSKNFFNLAEFEMFMPSELQKTREPRKLVAGTRSGTQLKDLTPEQILEADIDLTSLSPRIKSALDSMGIETIGQIVLKKRKSFKNTLTPSQIKSVEDFLAKYNLKLKDSDLEIVDGKVIRKKSSRTTENAPVYQDITKLSQEEQDAFLDTPILEFGFAPYIERAFKNQTTYTVMRDLIETDKKQLGYRLGSSGLAIAIERLLSQYGLKMQKRENQLKVTKYVNEIQIDKNKIPSELTAEQKQEYLSMPLETAGFTKTLIETIQKAGFDVKTIEDVVSHERNEYFGAGITDAQIRAIRNILAHYGHTVSSNDQYWRSRKLKQVSDSSLKLSPEEEYEQRKLGHAIRATEYLSTRENNINHDESNSRTRID